MLERGRDLGLREEAAPEALVVREVVITFRATWRRSRRSVAR